MPNILVLMIVEPQVQFNTNLAVQFQYYFNEWCDIMYPNFKKGQLSMAHCDSCTVGIILALV